MKTTFSLPFFLLAIALAVVTSAEEPQATTQGIWVIDIDGAIGPATSDYVLRGIADAEEADAKLVVLRMNTPGGLDNAMRDIIEAILSSDVPVASYVGPKGARAASAGTYISYASHVAAMAPATNLGAATPVQMGAPTLPSPDQDGSATQTDQATAMEKKMVNDASAYIRGLAELRDRNADWAEAAVREAASLDAESALAENVIDIIATDIPDLLTQLEGLVIDLDDEEVTLNLEGVDLYYYEADLRTEILSILTNPSMILVLGMIGIYGIILEFYNPGALVPGVIGAICLLLAAYSVQLLPTQLRRTGTNHPRRCAHGRGGDDPQFRHTGYWWHYCLFYWRTDAVRYRDRCVPGWPADYRRNSNHFSAAARFHCQDCHQGSQETHKDRTELPYRGIRSGS